MSDINREDEILKTINSLDGVEKAEVPAFLSVKVKARLAASKKENAFPFMFLLAKPAWSFAALAITIVFNIYMVTQVNAEHQQAAKTKDVAIESFAKEYGMISYSAYDKSN